MLKKPGADAEMLRRRVEQISEQSTRSRLPPIAEPPAPPAPAREPVEREQRKLAFRNATLILDEMFRVEVVIKDINAEGVRIGFQGRGTLPAIVTIIEPSFKLNRRARVVWQDVCSAGLEFLPE